MIFIFDRQHVGKPGRTVEDLGAGADLDGDGEVEVSEREAILTPAYIYPAKDYAESLGHTVHVLDKGSYSDRHRVAVSIAQNNPGVPCAYFACHFNAGGGDYAVYLHDSRSGGGQRLAHALADATGTLGFTKRTLAKPANMNEWTNAFYTVRGIYAGPQWLSGVCCEPLFLDNEDHQEHINADDLAEVGRALVDGAILWSKTA